MQPRLLQLVDSCIKREKLAVLGQHIYVAVSGGSDSIALLTALRTLGHHISVLHCNFQLRGDDSIRDENFVRDLSAKMGIDCQVRIFDTNLYAREHKISIEMAARELRYAWFTELLSEHPDSRIAIAHNSDDVTETFLLNLSKRTGIRGLSGIPYFRSNGLIRPLLDVSREEVHEYLITLNPEVSYCTDASNADVTYQRNYIRHQLIPAFEHINPNFLKGMQLTIRNLRGVEAFYLKSIEYYKGLVLDEHGDIAIDILLASPDPETLLFELLQPYRFSSQQCHQIISSLPVLPSGRVFRSVNNRLIRSWGKLEILPIIPFSFTPYEITLERLPLSIELPIGTLELMLTSSYDTSSPNILYIPHSWLEGKALSIHRPNKGQRMQPFGMKYGSKLISRILIDQKVSHRDREQALVLSLGEEPIWLINHCKSEQTRIDLDSSNFLSVQFTHRERV